MRQKKLHSVTFCTFMGFRQTSKLVIKGQLVCLSLHVTYVVLKTFLDFNAWNVNLIDDIHICKHSKKNNMKYEISKPQKISIFLLLCKMIKKFKYRYKAESKAQTYQTTSISHKWQSCYWNISKCAGIKWCVHVEFDIG